MAQPQQYQIPPQPQRSFSPPHNVSSPAEQQFGAFPPTKRQRLNSPEPREQAGTSYSQSPYPAISPGSTNPLTPGVSAHFPNVKVPNNVYNTPYSNGNTTPNPNPPHLNPQPSQHQNLLSEYSRPSYVAPRPDFTNYTIAPQNQGQGQGTMGPPSKPAEKPKEDSDMTDVLGGTGIDLREEEQYTFQLSFNSSLSGSQSGTITSGHSFTQFPPGDEASFYGAGPANAAAENANTKSQDELLQKAADKAWREAAYNLGVSRQNELNNPFLQVGLVQAKMAKVSRDHGIGLNIDLRNGAMGVMSRPDDFRHRDVNVRSTPGPDGLIVNTQGRFLPHDSMQVDQVALLSIATKFRLRGLIEDAARLARGRQTGSHGITPADWADVADIAVDSSNIMEIDGGVQNGWDSAVSPQSNPLKRSLSAANKLPTPVSEISKSQDSKTQDGEPRFTSLVVKSLRDEAKMERDVEEKRLQKRAERAARAAGGVTSRQGSIVPGTPGSIAPEIPDKIPTKKEQKKKAEAKVNEAASHAAANVTTAQFLGGGGGLFGKKKKYSWMNQAPSGGGGSGVSTPGRVSSTGLPGTPGGMVNEAPAKLTADGVRRLGTWREDKEKGAGIQLRDWIMVLEEDGNEKKALQKAYLNLDYSEPK